MCGIAGSSGDTSEATVAAMVARLRHRGPDFSDVRRLGPRAVFGHARLSIIDLSPLGNQPMSDPSGRFTITFNGEIYNFAAIRRELEAEGVVFRGHSDTEVVLHAFARWGHSSFARMSGMFALAIWDAREEELTLARDRFGEKPLFYAEVRGGLAFASELPALRCVPDIAGAPVSIAALNHYLALGYILSPLSIYEGVHKLEPATYIRFRNGRAIERTRYWDYRAAFERTTRDSEADSIARVETLLDRSVGSMVVGDVPVGAFLSGGIDSSAIATFARAHLSYPLHTFSVGFEEVSYDESADARRVAEFLHTVHHEVRMSTAEGRDIADRAAELVGEPFSDTSIVPMVEVARLARGFVKVALSGDGADEIFGGYLTYVADDLHRRVAIVPRPLRALVAGVVTRFLPQSDRKVGLAFKAQQFCKGLGSDFRDAHFKWRELHAIDERIAMLGQEELVRDSDPTRAFRAHYDEAEGLPLLAQHLYVDAKTWLVDDILVKVDRATMASSLESRAPFLDRDLVEYVASLPADLKLRGRVQKYALRSLLRKHVPAETIDKKKAGFNAPINSWFGHRAENEFRYFNKRVLERWRAAPLTR